MVHRGKSDAVRTIKERVRLRSYEYTDHAFAEMNDEGILDGDVQHAVVQGRLIARQTRGARGTRYVFRGTGMDGRAIEVVCRILLENVLVVTAYRV